MGAQTALDPYREPPMKAEERSPPRGERTAGSAPPGQRLVQLGAPMNASSRSPAQTKAKTPHLKPSAVPRWLSHTLNDTHLPELFFLNRFIRKSVFSWPNPHKQIACPPQGSEKQRPDPRTPHTGGSVRLCSALTPPVSPHRRPPASTDQSLLLRGADRRAVRQGGHLGIAHLPAAEGTTGVASRYVTQPPERRHPPRRPHTAAPWARDSRAMRAGPPLYSAAGRQVGAWLRPPRPDMSEHDPARRCRVTAGWWSGAVSRHDAARRGAAEGRPVPAPPTLRLPRSPTPAAGSRAARLSCARALAALRPSLPIPLPPALPEAAARAASRLLPLASRAPTHRQPRSLRRPARRNAGLSRPQRGPRPTPPSWPRGPPPSSAP